MRYRQAIRVAVDHIRSIVVYARLEERLWPLRTTTIPALNTEKLDPKPSGRILIMRINIVKLDRRAPRRKRPCTCSDPRLLGRGEGAAVH